MERQIIVLLGPPGSGKGTQAARLSKELKLPHISTGDLFRENIKKMTPFGIEAKGYIDKGELTPDSIVTKMLLARTKESDCTGGFILDGYPRRITQAETLEKEFPDSELIIINFTARDDVIIDRIAGRAVCRACGHVHHLSYYPPKIAGKCDLCGGELYQRSDDREEVVRERLNVYTKETAPLISYYKERGKLHTVSAEAAPDQVFEAAFSFL